MEGAATPDGNGAALPWAGLLLDADAAGADAPPLTGLLAEAGTAGADTAGADAPGADAPGADALAGELAEAGPAGDDGLADTVTVE